MKKLSIIFILFSITCAGQYESDTINLFDTIVQYSKIKHGRKHVDFSEVQRLDNDSIDILVSVWLNFDTDPPDIFSLRIKAEKNDSTTQRIDLSQNTASVYRKFWIEHPEITCGKKLTYNGHITLNKKNKRYIILDIDVTIEDPTYNRRIIFKNKWNRKLKTSPNG